MRLEGAEGKPVAELGRGPNWPVSQIWQKGFGERITSSGNCNPRRCLAASLLFLGTMPWEALFIKLNLELGFKVVLCLHSDSLPPLGTCYHLRNPWHCSWRFGSQQGLHGGRKEGLPRRQSDGDPLHSTDAHYCLFIILFPQSSQNYFPVDP